jgi:hypothetical protein
MTQLLLAGSVAALVCLSASDSLAQGGGGGRQRNNNNNTTTQAGGGRQGRGNMDPAQMQQRMLDRYKETLEIKDETEWKVIQPLIQKVLDARAAISTRGRGAGGRGNRGGGATAQTDPTQSRNPEADALQKAVDSKGSSAELKAALAKYAEAHKTKQTELEKAQVNLRKVLTARQEAIATLSNLL